MTFRSLLTYQTMAWPPLYVVWVSALRQLMLIVQLASLWGTCFLIFFHFLLPFSANVVTYALNSNGLFAHRSSHNFIFNTLISLALSSKLKRFFIQMILHSHINLRIHGTQLQFTQLYSHVHTQSTAISTRTIIYHITFINSNSLNFSHHFKLRRL
jgi:hypothetical protein